MIKTKIFNEYTLFKYLWILVVMPKEFQLISLILIAINISHKSIKKIDTIFILLIGYSFIHVISIFINMNFLEFQINRILAAINTMSIWVVSAIIYIYYKNNNVDINLINKYCYKNMIILISLSIVSIILYYIANIDSIEILGRKLYAVDWFQEEAKLRFIGLLDYSNLVVILYMLIFPFYFNYIQSNKTKIKKVFLIALSFIPVLLTLSRSGYTVILVAFIFLFIYTIKVKLDKNILCMSVCVAISFAAVFIYKFNSLDYIVKYLNEFINGRQGSTSTRMYLYRESISMATNISPILGMGIKITSKTGYPLGSHSTYIGLYYKTGILGIVLSTLAIFIGNAKIILKKMFNKNYVIVSIFFLMLLSLFIFEDIDGTNWSIILYFCIMGCLLNIKNWETQRYNIK